MFNKDRYMRLSEIEYRKHELKISLSLSISLVRKLKVCFIDINRIRPLRSPRSRLRLSKRIKTIT